MFDQNWSFFSMIFHPYYFHQFLVISWLSPLLCFERFQWSFYIVPNIWSKINKPVRNRIVILVAWTWKFEFWIKNVFQITITVSTTDQISSDSHRNCKSSIAQEFFLSPHFSCILFCNDFLYLNSDGPQFWLKEVYNLCVSVSLKCQLFFSKRNENYLASPKFSIFFAMFLFCPLVSWLRNSNFGGSLSAELPSWIFTQIRGSIYPNFNDLKNYLKKDQF